MIDGTYKVNLQTPLGFKSGYIVFLEENGILKGSVRALGYENLIKNGKVSGDNFEFQGILQTGFGSIEYMASGTIVGDKLQANAKTKFGAMQINGTKVQN